MDEPIILSGLVLRETKYKENDRILAILTPDRGVVSAIAKGSLRLKSKLFSACGLFCYSEFQVLPGRNLYTVKEAQVKTVFHSLSASIESMALAMYLGEVAMMLSPSDAESENVLRLLLNSLYMIEKGSIPLRQIKAVYELRVACQCGFMPQLVMCSGCGRYEGPGFYLDPEDGRLLCHECAIRAGQNSNLDEAALKAVRHICLADDKKIFSFRISEKSGRILSAIAERYLLYRLGSAPKSYDFLKTVLE